jgi:integrase
MLIVMRIDNAFWGSGTVLPIMNNKTKQLRYYRARIPVRKPKGGDLLRKADGSTYRPVEGTHKTNRWIAVERAEARLYEIYAEHGIPIPETPLIQTRSQAETAQKSKNNKNDKSKWTVEKYANHYRSFHLDSSTHSGATIYSYERDFKNHLIPILGSKIISEITIDDIDQMVSVMKTRATKRTGRPVNSNTRGKILKRIRQMFDVAVEEDRILESNPVLNRHFPREVKPAFKGRLANPKLQDYVLEVLAKARLAEDPREYLMLLLMLFGMRQAERTGLTWSSIENLETPDEAYLTISQQLLNDHDGQGTRIVQRTKTGNERSFYLGETLREAFLAYKRQQDGWKKTSEWAPRAGMEDLVLTSETGTPIYQTKANELWHELSEKYFSAKKLSSFGITDFTEHGMRHLAASYIVANTPDLLIAGKLLGHTSQTMTEYYAETDKELTKTSVRVHDAFLGAGHTHHSLDGLFDEADEGASS